VKKIATSAFCTRSPETTAAEVTANKKKLNLTESEEFLHGIKTTAEKKI
jgi:hypothetical protein